MKEGWAKKLRNKELHDFYSSANSIRVTAGHVSIMEEKRNEYRILVGKLGCQSSKEDEEYLWEDHNKMDVKSIKLEIVASLKIGTNVRFCAYGLERSCLIEGGENVK